MKKAQAADFEFDLEIAEDEILSRGSADSAPAPVMDEYMHMLRQYPNRLRINSVNMNSIDDIGSGKQLTEISFNLNANPHPKCNFEYICVYVNCSSWENAVILDISPKEVKSTEPVKYVTKYTGGLGLKIDKVEIGPIFNAENSTENNIYFLKIIATGVGDTIGEWTFDSEPHTRLYFNNLLTLLVEHDPKGADEGPRFDVSARIKLEGWQGLIPVYGSKVVAMKNY
jgi:hypothetical protein